MVQKQSQKQIVNVIINPEKKKRRRRTKPKEDNTNTNTNTNTNYPSAVYNPNIISRNRQPSYGIASINPVIENPILNNIADAIKNPAPKVEEYKKIIQDDLEKNILNKVDDNIENIVNETLSNKGVSYLKNYFQQNPSLLSGASTYQQSKFAPSVIEEEEEVDKNNNLITPQKLTNENNLQAPKKNQSPQPRFQIKPRKKPVGRLPKNYEKLTELERVDLRIKSIKSQIDKASQNNNQKKLLKLDKELRQLLFDREDLTKNQEVKNYSSDEIQQLLNISPKNKND